MDTHTNSEDPMTTSTSPVDQAVRQAQVAFAVNIAGDSAVDSIVYDLQAYQPEVDDSIRFVALTRDGVHGFFADADVASLAVVNRRAFQPKPCLCSWSGRCEAHSICRVCEGFIGADGQGDLCESCVENQEYRS